MISLDAEAIRRFTTGAAGSKLAQLDVFAEIDSTNSYLMRMPGPVPGAINIAATNNQTAGRGRHGKTWQSPPGTGLCLSAAYTFASRVENLPALTLALGLGAITALEELGAVNVKLKWPNDLVALDGKLGGILTEVQPQSTSAVTVVTGIGVNVDLNDRHDFVTESDWARHVVDMKSICDSLPRTEEIAGRLATCLLQAFVEYETSGFAAIADRWSRYDWLLGREIVVDTARAQISGAGAGIADDGALLVDTLESGVQRVTSGTVSVAVSTGGPV
ncbi:MAG: biotin--[acetyl-CoA-carboxylase] ligase [Proteobacteria bacterium]|nr:biotin--[acetyl-CoA-carboxylase] ligase [Pseudomonadota bacterium]MCH9005914.1 biotin--[acetyl-CoA-carboxylase] ligase [Pseudomonadota bacterium]